LAGIAQDNLGDTRVVAKPATRFWRPEKVWSISLRGGRSAMSNTMRIIWVVVVILVVLSLVLSTCLPALS